MLLTVQRRILIRGASSSSSYYYYYSVCCIRLHLFVSLAEGVLVRHRLAWPYRQVFL